MSFAQVYLRSLSECLQLESRRRGVIVQVCADLYCCIAGFEPCLLSCPDNSVRKALCTENRVSRDLGTDVDGFESYLEQLYSPGFC